MKSIRKRLATATVATLVAGNLFGSELFAQASGNDIDKQEFSETDIQGDVYISERNEMLEKSSRDFYNLNSNNLSRNQSGPRVDISTLTVSHKEAKIGDVVTIGANITSDTAIRSVQIWLQRPRGGTVDIFETEATASLNTNTGRWEIRFPVTDQIQEGTWQIAHFSIQTTNSSTWTIIRNSALGTSGIRQDLSAASFIVSHDFTEDTNRFPDISAPIIDLSTLTVSNKNPRIGETITVGVNVTDDTAVSDVLITYRGPSGGRPTTGLFQNFASFNPNTGLWELRIPITTQTEEGLWQIEDIFTTDPNRNSASIRNSDLGTWGTREDLSAGDFTVGEVTVPTPEPTPEPEIPSQPTPEPTPEPEKPTQPEIEDFTPIWNGHNMSPVFDSIYYLNRYADLRHMGAQEAFNHFINHGMEEGRQAHASFNVKIYRNNYSDLNAAFGDNLPQYFMHFITTGRFEGRNATTEIPAMPTPEKPTLPETDKFSPIWKGHDMSTVFDADFYRNKYNDLKHMSAKEAFTHFINHGMQEARQAHVNFNVSAYRNRYEDLRDAFGDDLPQYYLHFVTNGRSENRSAQ